MPPVSEPVARLAENPMPDDAPAILARSPLLGALRERRSRRFGLAVTLTLLALGCGPPSAVATAELPGCEWCGATEAPAELSWQARIAPLDEAGERLVIEGTVYEPAGETPASGVVIYAYHTDAEGIYRKLGDETGNGLRHGHLRAWVRTGDDGRYRFDTIRPASYPDSTIPQHVHMTVLPPGGEEDWIDSVHFTDDPLLTERERRRLRNRGGSGVVTPVQDEDGVWRVTRDVVLER